MNQKHKSVYVYTHTHTISFVYLLRTLCGRCLQWVSAFWQGIRRAARLATERTPETGRQNAQSVSVSRRSGCWFLAAVAKRMSSKVRNLGIMAVSPSLATRAKLPLFLQLSKLLMAVLKSSITSQAKFSRTIGCHFHSATSTEPNLCRKAVA